jgi:hypothetical protein
MDVAELQRKKIVTVAIIRENKTPAAVYIEHLQFPASGSLSCREKKYDRLDKIESLSTIWNRTSPLDYQLAGSYPVQKTEKVGKLRNPFTFY